MSDSAASVGGAERPPASVSPPEPRGGTLFPLEPYPRALCRALLRDEEDEGKATSHPEGTTTSHPGDQCSSGRDDRRPSGRRGTRRDPIHPAIADAKAPRPGPRPNKPARTTSRSPPEGGAPAKIPEKYKGLNPDHQRDPNRHTAAEATAPRLEPQSNKPARTPSRRPPEGGAPAKISKNKKLTLGTPALTSGVENRRGTYPLSSAMRQKRCAGKTTDREWFPPSHMAVVMPTTVSVACPWLTTAAYKPWAEIVRTPPNARRQGSVGKNSRATRYVPSDEKKDQVVVKRSRTATDNMRDKARPKQGEGPQPTEKKPPHQSLGLRKAPPTQ